MIAGANKVRMLSFYFMCIHFPGVHTCVPGILAVVYHSVSVSKGYTDACTGFVCCGRIGELSTTEEEGTTGGGLAAPIMAWSDKGRVWRRCMV